MYFNLKEIKTVTQKNTQIHLIILSYTNTNEQKIRTTEANRLTNNSDKKEMKIEVSYNGHLKNCVCKKCHDAREMLKLWWLK